VMRFYPDVFRPEGLYRTKLPNLLMMMILARSWIDRGDSSEDVGAALEDYRRAVRLGRLLRQDDVYVGTDGIGLYCMRHALEPMARRLREAGEDRLADQALLALANVTAERVTHTRTNRSIDIGPYLRWSWFGSQLELPEEKLDEIGRMATQHPERRFRRLATDQLCVVYWIGDDDQKAGARDWMDQVAASGDPILAKDAECREDPLEADLIARPGT